jgi:FMN reductase
MPLIVGFGGTTRAGSSTERVLRAGLQLAAGLGAETALVAGPELALPHYDPGVPERTEHAARLVDLLRRADGVLVASPGYHGTVSGLVKNALDYVEDLSKDPRPYLDGRAVAPIAVSWGWQAAVSTMQTLRQTIHALRGWPTPVGVAIGASGNLFAEDGTLADAALQKQLQLAVEQVVWFAGRR